jgi:UDP-glucose 4-epimerase
MKRILITGSSGYIGQHLVSILSGSHYLRGVDIVKRDNLDLEVQDIRRFQDPNNHYDTVIHLAALVNVGESTKIPWDYYHTNILGTKHILDNVNYDNFIFASTGAAARPQSPYGISKRAAEDIVIDHCHKNNKNFSIFRFYNVIGKSGFDPTNPDGLFYNLVRACESGEFRLYGTDYDTHDGTCIRDYVHVMEICRAIEKAIDRPANQIENLGHGQGHSVKNIIDIFKKVNSVNFKVTTCARRDGDLPVSVLDNPSSYIEKIYTIEDLLKI